METNKPFIIMVGIIALSQLTLLTLKAIKIINWSWLWILAPLWIPYAAFIVFGILIILYILIYGVAERIFKKK